nr:MAG TPA: hypothetical protein [Bacteriophage sp.]
MIKTSYNIASSIFTLRIVFNVTVLLYLYFNVETPSISSILESG